MTLVLVKPKPRVRVPATTRPQAPVQATAAVRLLDYLGLGAQVAMMPGGLALATQADHVTEVVRVAELAT